MTLNKLKEQQEKLLMIEQGARDNFRAFNCLIDRNYEFNWHHREIAKKLEQVEKGEIRRLMIFMPPRHGKSQLATVHFPAWYLGRNPVKEIITASYSADLSQDFGSKTRDIVGDDTYKRIFNITLKSDEKSKAKWRTDGGGSYTSVGVGGAVTGRGANILIIDDPIKNREEAESETYREKIWSWYTSTARTRLEKDAAIIVILTRWHLDDLAGRLLAQNPDQWEVIDFPAIAKEDEKHRKKGEPLWEGKFDLKALEDIKNDIGIYDWSALYQQSPVLTENQEFKKEWFKSVHINDLQRVRTANYLTIDTAMSKKAEADYTGFCINYIDKGNNWHLKAYRMKLNAKELVDYIFKLYSEDKYDKIGIEKTAYTWGLKPYLDEQQRKRDIFLPIVELDHRGTAKDTRIRGLVPRYSSGSVYHIEGECRDLEEELLTFPKSLNDDVSDALAYQLQITEYIDNAPNKYKQSSPVLPYYGDADIAY